MLNKEKLSDAVGDLLNLPRCGRQGKAYTIVLAMVKVITDALLRGETISIDGFGIFRTKTYPARLRANYFYSLLGKGGHCALVPYPETRRITFTPAKPLKRFVHAHAD